MQGCREGGGRTLGDKLSCVAGGPGGVMAWNSRKKGHWRRNGGDLCLGEGDLVLQGEDTPHGSGF